MSITFHKRQNLQELVIFLNFETVLFLFKNAQVKNTLGHCMFSLRNWDQSEKNFLPCKWYATVFFHFDFFQFESGFEMVAGGGPDGGFPGSLNFVLVVESS